MLLLMIMSGTKLNSLKQKGERLEKQIWALKIDAIAQSVCLFQERSALPLNSAFTSDNIIKAHLRHYRATT